MFETYKIDSTILQKKFLCDLTKCKGGCCTVYGENGAPLLSEEIPIIEEYLPIIKKYMKPKSIDFLDKYGFWEHDTEGELAVTCINKRDCVFVYYDEGSDIAKCAIEKAYFAGEITFQKPISCHLFPIRVRGEHIYYEEFSMCEHALKNGEENNVNLVDFCKDSIELKFSNEFYVSLSNLAKSEKKIF